MTRRRALLWLVAAAAFVLGVLVWPYGDDFLDPSSSGRTPGRLLVVMVSWGFVAAGLAAAGLYPERKLGRRMVGLGFVSLLITLVNTREPLLFTAAHVLDAVPFPWLIWLLLAFPEDRLRTTSDRVLVLAATVSAAVPAVGILFWDPTASGCPDCPPDLNMLLTWPQHAAAWFGYVADPAFYAQSLLMAAVAVTLARRWLRATVPGRRVLSPVVLPAVALFAGQTGFFTVQVFLQHRVFDGPNRVYEIVFLTLFLLRIGVAGGFLLGLARAQGRRARVGDLVIDLSGGSHPLEDALSRALGDPSLVVAFALDDGQRWVDREGREVRMPAEQDTERAVTFLERDGRRLGALVHDPAVLDDQRLIRAVASAAALAVDNHRLAAEVRAQLTEVRASRARIVSAGDDARRRVERDLHDGAQQRLVAAALKLRQAERSINGQLPPDARTALAAAADELAGGLADLRELARGIHPAVLTEQGLAPALRSLVARSPVAVDLGEVPEQRFPPAVEVAAYFVVTEALTNTAKHAPSATSTVSVRPRGDTLVAEVSDDGPGGATVGSGSGLRGLTDRVEALGGSLRVDSPPGGGTRLTAELPCG